MYIPDTLNIVASDIFTSASVIRHVSYRAVSQETVPVRTVLAQRFPDQYDGTNLKFPATSLDGIREALCERYNHGRTASYVQQNVPNVPHNGWKCLGSDGHCTTIVHPLWGVWTMSNTEYLYFCPLGAFEEQMFLFYVVHGVLRLGLAAELEDVRRSTEDPNLHVLAELTEAQIGDVITINTKKSLVIAVTDTEVKTWELPTFKSATWRKHTLANSGYGYHKVQVGYLKSDTKYPALGLLGSVPIAEHMQVFADRIEDILTEGLQIRKEFKIMFQALPERHRAFYHVAMQLPGQVIQDLNKANPRGAQIQSGISILCITVSRAKKGNATVEVDVRHHNGGTTLKLEGTPHELAATMVRTWRLQDSYFQDMQGRLPATIQILS